MEPILLNRRVFEVPDRGRCVLELRDAGGIGYAIVGIDPNGNEETLGRFPGRMVAEDNFNWAVNEYAEYAVEEEKPE